MHLHNQLDTVQYLRVVVPESLEIKNKILTEYHPVPYSAHAGIQWTLNKVRQCFYWKGQTGDVRRVVDSCKIFQTEKSDHSLSKRQLKSLLFLSRLEGG